MAKMAARKQRKAQHLSIICYLAVFLSIFDWTIQPELLCFCSTVDRGFRTFGLKTQAQLVMRVK